MDQDNTPQEENEQDAPELTSHTISIPNAEFDDVVVAAAELGMSYGRIRRSVTMYDGQPIQTVDVEFSTDEPNIVPYLYAFGERFSTHSSFIADGEVWENTYNRILSK